MPKEPDPASVEYGPRLADMTLMPWLGHWSGRPEPVSSMNTMPAVPVVQP